MKPLRILVADDHEVVRRGARALLEAQPGWTVVAEAANGREAEEQAKKLRPDVVVLDISMPELNGLDAARLILKEFPQTEILILTMHESEELMREVLQAGAKGYVLKSDVGKDLVAAVAALSQHKPYFTTTVAEMVLDGYRQHVLPNQHAKELPALSARERQVTQLLAEGKCNKEVAAMLFIGVKTVETHRANIMRKLNIHSVSDLVRYAIRNRIVTA
ncbi:MAG: response regulator transcription factor [Candidatus Acidiferrales bacterium]|jgi:DNA-binding NarL/FixJ family response regulator